MRLRDFLSHLCLCEFAACVSETFWSYFTVLFLYLPVCLKFAMGKHWLCLKATLSQMCALYVSMCALHVCMCACFAHFPLQLDLKAKLVMQNARSVYVFALLSSLMQLYPALHHVERKTGGLGTID